MKSIRFEPKARNSEAPLALDNEGLTVIIDEFDLVCFVNDKTIR